MSKRSAKWSRWRKHTISHRAEAFRKFVAALERMTAEPLALYVHWPFCVSKCPYCDFNSHVRATIDQDEWREALLADLAHEARLLPGRRLRSIFFGGGTPSLMEPATVEAMIDARATHWSPAATTSRSRSRPIRIRSRLTASPISRRPASIASRSACRASTIGALAFLGRAHSAREGWRALEIAQKTFRRVSFDLIYALPGETEDSWSATLAQALCLGTTHLSLYQLTIEPGTRFASMVAKHDSSRSMPTAPPLCTN